MAPKTITAEDVKTMKAAELKEFATKMKITVPKGSKVADARRIITEALEERQSKSTQKSRKGRAAAKATTKKATAGKSTAKKGTAAKKVTKEQAGESAEDRAARRERFQEDVVDLREKGYTNAQIAEELGADAGRIALIVYRHEHPDEVITGRNEKDVAKKVHRLREDGWGWSKLAVMSGESESRVRALYDLHAGKEGAHRNSDIGRGGRDFGGGVRKSEKVQRTAKTATKSTTKKGSTKKGSTRKASAKKVSVTPAEVQKMKAAELKELVATLGLDVPKGSKVADVKRIVKESLAG